MGILRLFLAFVVAIGHYRVLVLSQYGSVERDAPYLFYLMGGLDAGHAVMLFYMISGFLISYALSYKYAEKPVIYFYKARFLRIYPLYWTLAVCTILMSGSFTGYFLGKPVVDLLTGFGLFGADWVLMFTSYPTAYWGHFPPLLNPAWSLASEVSFYALAPWLLRSYRLAIAALLLSLSLRGYAIYNIEASANWVYYFFPTTLCFFLVGHFSRLAYERYNKLGAWNLLFLAPFFVLAWKGQTAPTFDNLYFLGYIGCAAVFIPYLFHSTKDCEIINKIGDLSYPVYLIHTIMLSFLFLSPTSLITKGSYYSAGPQGLAVYIAVVLVVSWVMHWLVEKAAIDVSRGAIGKFRLRHA